MMKRLLIASVAASLFTGGRAANAQSDALAPGEVATPAQMTPTTVQPSHEEMGTGVLDRLIIQVGAGLSSTTLKAGERMDAQHSTGMSFHLDVGLRLTRYLGMGVHFGKSMGSVDLFYDDDLSDEPGHFYESDYNPLAIGAALYLYPTEQIWITPWIGRTDFPVSRTENYIDDTKLAYGVELGTDFATASRGTHRLGGYASISLSEGFYKGEGVASYAVGLSYRYQ